MAKSKTKVTTKQVPVYKQWWFWVIIILILAGFGSSMRTTDDSSTHNSGSNASDVEQNSITEPSSEVKDYTGQDAKKAYDELKASGYNIKFIFDRPNQGGFTEESFQDYVINDSFGSPSYAEMPFVVKSQQIFDKNVYLYIDYGSVVESENKQASMEASLEEKLSIVNAMTACEQYGKQNYRNFKIHSILGKIAEYADDENTWFLKYNVDYDGYENRTMECYVTGTSAAPVVSRFLVY